MSEAAYKQLSLFQEEPETHELDPRVYEYSLVYLVTCAGGNQGNLWVLKNEDAMKLCEDECSHGQGRGGRWMFMFTRLDHFIRRDYSYGDEHEDFLFIYDNGKQDRDFERLGIIKPTLKERAELLESMGYIPVTDWKGTHKQEEVSDE